jgi:hypothetical protein
MQINADKEISRESTRRTRIFLSQFVFIREIRGPLLLICDDQRLSAAKVPGELAVYSRVE